MTGSARLVPTRDLLIDAGFAFALTVLAMVGFRSAFGGTEFVVVGAIAALLGIAVASVISHFRLPAVFALAVVLLAFIAFGSVVAVREESLFGVLPTPAGATGLVDGAISGWRRLLTTLPPSGSLGNLLAVPFLCGYTSALLSALLALRTKWLSVLLAAPATVLGLSIVFGTREPFSILVQGAVFAAVCLAWLSVRRARERRMYLQNTPVKRMVGAVVMLAVTAAAGLVVGPNLPGATADARYVLRDDTVPPFDPRDYGSPLSAYQRYLIGEYKDEVLFTIDGLPGDNPVDYVRLAVMDDYDGVVWRVSPKGGSTSSQFIRVGESVPVDVTGEVVDLDVTIGMLPGIWVPDAGVVTGVRWNGEGERNGKLRDVFRLATATDMAAVPVASGWQPGDSYTISGIIVPQPAPQDLAGQLVDTSIRLDLTNKPPSELASLAAGITKGKATPYEQLKSLEEFLRKGYYTTGDVDAGQRASAPGHSYGRLLDFVAADKAPDGNAEQYASAMALLARTLGLPARVVMGFRVKPGQTEVTGSDVDAWVEVAFADSGWVRFDPTPRDNTATPDNTKKKQRPQFESQQVPPPPAVPPQLPSPPTKEGKKKKLPDPPKVEPLDRPTVSESSHVLLFAAAGTTPVVLAVVPIALIVALKRRRRNKRRTASATTSRIAGGWQEFLDQARDIGLAVPANATRREVALMLSSVQAPPLAAAADASIFGPANPTDEEATYYWQQIDLARRDLRTHLSAWQRFRAAISTTSLRKRA